MCALQFLAKAAEHTEEVLQSLCIICANNRKQLGRYAIYAIALPLWGVPS